MNKNILFISYDGMTDPLGQSQVIPYLSGLVKEGYDVTLLSCDKKHALIKHESEIIQLLDDKKIKWAHVLYKNNPPVFSSVLNYFALKRMAFKLHKQINFTIVHGRSDIPSLVALSMKKRFGTKFIFDMRGFWADEKVDSGLLNLTKPFYRIIYKYLKSREAKLLSDSDYIVSLTEAAKKEILKSKDLNTNHLIEVIPCCVDTELFDPNNSNHAKIVKKFRSQLKITDDDFVVSYLGALGNWYLLDEMLHFFQRLLLRRPEAKFLFITPEKEENILMTAKKMNIDPARIIIQKASRNEVSSLLLLSKLSVFFIRPSFSKIASSPTKMAEVMAMGIPVICNDKVGDVENIINQTQCGFAIKSFTEQEYDVAVSNIENLLAIPCKDIRQQALNLFSLEEGVRRYTKIYQSVVA